MADTTKKIIRGVVNSRGFTITSPITQWDYGWQFIPEIEDLPPTYRLDFSNEEKHGAALPVYCSTDGAEVPTELIDTGKDVWVWFVRIGDGFGITEYKWRIPNKCKPKTEQDEPTPSQQSSIDQLIVRSNEAVEQAEQSASDASTSAQNASADAERAEEARTDAQNYATQAQTSANNASASAQASANSATASAQSASQSAQIKSDVEDLVDDAQGYANASAQSASASANSASQALGYAQSASASAQSASGYASQAQTSAQTASSKASEASTSASTASQKATEAAQSASQALSYKTDAESAKTASQTAQGLAESARDSAISAKNDAESARDDAESARDEAQQAVASIADALDDKAPIITDTASGAIASFSDGVDDLPLESLVVDINPIQDLHGQDAPWPAGGGKNLFNWNRTGGTPNPTTVSPSTSPRVMDTEHYFVGATRNNYYNISQVIAYSVANGIVSVTTASGGFGVGFPVKVEENTNYTSSYTEISNAKISIGFYSANWEYIDELDGNNAGTIKSFTTPANTAYVVLVVVPRTHGAENVAQAKDIQLELGTTATFFAPYENICPISGWTSVDVEQSGVNVWDEELEDGYIDTNTGEFRSNTSNVRTKTLFSVVPSATYFFCAEGVTGNKRFGYCFYDGGQEYVSGSIVDVNNPITVPSNAHYMAFFLPKSWYTGQNVSINYHSTDHSYHPYTGRSITIDLGQTVYGAKLYPLEGKALIDMAIVDLGTLTPYKTPANVFVWHILTPTNGTILCSNYATAQSGFAPANMPDKTVCTTNAIGTYYPVALKDSSYYNATAEEMKTAMSGVQLCYELATPLEIQLDAHAINSLYGVNNIWADSGDTEVEYRADTKAYIAKKIAEAIASLT